MTDRLETRADFEKFQRTARQRWDALWQGDQVIVISTYGRGMWAMDAAAIK